MVDLVCWLPVWNTTEWYSRSVRLDVQKSSPPIITGKPFEEIHLKVGDTERLLECQSSGKPVASLNWTKNGELLPRKMVILDENGTSVILLHSITLDTMGEYRCIATNLVGKATKIFRVIVQDQVIIQPASSSAWGTTAAVLVPILIIAFLTTVGFLVWKMQVQKKIVNHLSRVVFRDTERQTESTA